MPESPSNPQTSKKHPFVKFGWMVMIIGLVVAVLGGCALVYYAYVSAQEEYFTERNFRVLSSINTEITKTFLGYGKIFDSIINPCQKPTKDEGNSNSTSGYNGCINRPVLLLKENEEVKENRLNLQAKLKTTRAEIQRLRGKYNEEKKKNFVDPQKNTVLSDLRLELKTKINDRKLIEEEIEILNVKTLEVPNSEIAGKFREIAELNSEVLKWERKENPSGGYRDLEVSRGQGLIPSNVVFESRLTGSVAIIDFRYKNDHLSNPSLAKLPTKHIPPNPPVVTVQMDLSAILKRLVGTQVFAHFILADEKGNVIFHQKTKDANANMTLTSLDVLFKQKSPGDDFSPSLMRNNSILKKNRTRMNIQIVVHQLATI